MRSSLYQQDFYAWTQEQLQLFQSGELDRLDIPALIEELESMGASEKRELVNRLSVLLMHLLKWNYQPSLQSRSWLLTIKEQRLKLEDHLQDNPSLGNTDRFQESLIKAYRLALVKAEQETGLSSSTFPQTCPFTIAQILDHDFLPECLGD
ncbi:MAG: DUF29 domain-containing protein [Prochlorotrichaceae cyanobacterium]|jgi:hypothetical protein